MIDNAEDLLRELKNVAKQYENEKLYTFEISRKRMAEDCIRIVKQLQKEIEEQNKQIEKMKCCKNCKYNDCMHYEVCDNCNNHDKWEMKE